MGPSSSHTMGPKKAAEIFFKKNRPAFAYRVTLFGSLAATGRGHLTDKALTDVFPPGKLEIVWSPKTFLPLHPNGMEFEALKKDGSVSAKWRVYSVGGGDIKDDMSFGKEPHRVYPHSSMTTILEYVSRNGMSFWEYVHEHEGKEIWDHLNKVWSTMINTIQRGLNNEGVLPGGLGLSRKAASYYKNFLASSEDERRSYQLFAYALACAEENAAGGTIVTAPTCGSCGIVPSVAFFLKNSRDIPHNDILHALATAGLIGNLARTNASISGAEVGCQGEVGVACSMASGMAAQLMGGNPRQIEYAAEIALEHKLGLTCDPKAGLVQIPCIERNALAAKNAIDNADYSLPTDGTHMVSFDEAVATMLRTGRDLKRIYRETSG